ncbi:MAG: hypothetical protein ACJ78Q_01825 [Chloroflexia bacterium]
MADDLRRLLDYIIEHSIRQDESVEAQLDASAIQDVPAEIAANMEAQRAHVGQFGPYFARGLRQAAGGPLVVEDTTPEGNLIAEAFARYLVSPGLATSQSESVSDNNYRYTFEVDWPRLGAIARQAGIDLDAALRAPAGNGERP